MKIEKKQALIIGAAILAIGLLLYERKRIMKFFNIKEFDSPDKPGSGSMMKASTLAMLDKARSIAGIPFKIESGYRTVEHNKEVGGVANSAHTRGYAADIVTTPGTRDKIIKALVQAGFKRIGIGTNFVHADNDPSLPQNTAWGYPTPNTPAPFNPFLA